ncbi:MAG: hypothetical protein HY079_00170 [Elusimicrobia bacterium]|nr:hypothetical protein [Elusimicrobiota bacterium]
MNPNIERLSARLVELERELEEEFERELAEKRARFRYSIATGRAEFAAEMASLHRRLRTGWVAFLWDAPPASLLVAPVIYSLLVPLALFDAWLWLYQSVCFPIYGIDKVERARYLQLDRGDLPYLNWIERANCDYCGYANGLIAYAREVAARTEQYFCPIKHSRRCTGAHSRYGLFVDFGDAEDYRRSWRRLRDELRPEEE